MVTGHQGEGTLPSLPGPTAPSSADLHTRRNFMPEESRLEKLRRLVIRLEENMDICETKELAALARQYREALKEIEEIEGAEQNDDDISEILSERAAAGKSGAVR